MIDNKKGLKGILDTNDTDNLLNIESPSNSEVSFEVVLKYLLSNSDIDMKSRIKARQVIPLSKLLIYEQVFKVKLAGDFARQILRLSVSESGAGRKELTDIVRGIPNEYEQFDPLQIKNTLFGGK